MRYRPDMSRSIVFEENNGRLVAELTTSDFASAFAVMSHIALIAERRGHHPDMTISWNRVTISIYSHDVGMITDRDHQLAQTISAEVWP